MTPLRELFDQAGDGVTVIDTTSDRVIYWNRSAQGILGYPPMEAMGMACFDVFKGLGEGGTAICGPDCSVLQCAFRGGRIHSFNLLTPHKGRNAIWLSMSTLYVRDIDRLMRAQELVGEFVSRASEMATGVPRSPHKASQEAQTELTKRERQVLDLLRKGLSTKDVADRLTISETTARNHIQNILSKLGVHSRLEAALNAAAAERL